MRRGLVVLVGAACGGTSSAPPVPAELAVSLVAPRAHVADVEVATVNGRPVWGSCLAGQIARGEDRARVLDQCIDFELLAQAAERRGLARDREVIDATRTAMVSQLVGHGFEDRYDTPAALGERLDKVVAENAWRMHRPDLRASTYVRITLPPKGGSPAQEARARQLAEQIARELAGETGLMSPHVQAVAERITRGTGVELTHADVQAKVPRDLDPTYGKALFEIAEVGRTSGAVRTPWGWDVILWSGGLPPLERTREQIAAEAFPDVRRAFYPVWVNQIVKQLGIRITVDQEQVARLTEAAP